MNAKAESRATVPSRIRITALALFAIGNAPFLEGCGGKEKGNSGTGSGWVRPHAVLQSPGGTVLSGQGTVRLVRMDFEDTLEIPVRLDPDERRSEVIAAPAAGRIEEVFIRSDYQSIRAGEAIASLYSPELTAAQREFLLLDARGDGLRDEAASRLGRMGFSSGLIRSLSSRGKPFERIPIASPKDGFAVSEGGARQSETTGAGMETNAGGGSGAMGGMSAMGGDGAGRNVSPPSGAMPDAGNALKVGANVDRGAILAIVNDLEAVAASMAFPLDRAGFIRTGDSVLITLPSLGYQAPARIDFIESRVADTALSLSAKAYLANPQKNLKPGSLGSARLIARADSAWVLPRPSVHDLGEKWIVWARSKTDTSAFQAREVRIGRAGGRFIEILEGLAPGDEVAANASLLLDPDALAEPLPLQDPDGETRRSGQDHTGQDHSGLDHSGQDHSAHGPSGEAGKDGKDGHAADHGTHEQGKGAAILTLTPHQETLAGIKTAKAVHTTLFPSRTFRAMTRYDARSSVTVPARAEGLIKRVSVSRPGERVAKGQVLAHLQSETLLAAQQEFLLSVSQAGTLPDRAMAGTQTRAAQRRLLVLGMSEGRIRSLAKNGIPEALLPILSPRDGVLLETGVRPGRYMGAGSVLFTIGGGDRIWVETWMLPEEMTAYPKGTEALVRIEGIPEGPFRGHIDHVQQESSVAGALGVAHVGIANPQGRILQGLQAWVTLRQAGRRVLAVPATSLIESGSSIMAWVRTGPHDFSPRMVAIGIRTAAAVEIVEGIREGEEIVVSGAYLLNSEWVIRQGAGNVHSGH